MKTLNDFLNQEPYSTYYDTISDFEGNILERFITIENAITLIINDESNPQEIYSKLLKQEYSQAILKGIAFIIKGSNFKNWKINKVADIILRVDTHEKITYAFSIYENQIKKYKEESDESDKRWEELFKNTIYNGENVEPISIFNTHDNPLHCIETFHSLLSKYNFIKIPLSKFQLHFIEVIQSKEFEPIQWIGDETKFAEIFNDLRINFKKNTKRNKWREIAPHFINKEGHTFNVDQLPTSRNKANNDDILVKIDNEMNKLVKDK